MKARLGKTEEQIQKYYECGALGKWADMISRRPPSTWDGRTGLIMSRPEKKEERGE
jgi:hypothetical protein